jgi:hypothetical protein
MHRHRRSELPMCVRAGHGIYIHFCSCLQSLEPGSMFAHLLAVSGISETSLVLSTLSYLNFHRRMQAFTIKE